jgi:hypothetical protein
MLNVKYDTAVQLTMKAAERNFNLKKIIELIEDKIEESVQNGLFMCEVNINKDLFQNFYTYKKFDNIPYIKTMLNVIKAEFEKNKFNCTLEYYSTGHAKFTLVWGIN